MSERVGVQLDQRSSLGHIVLRGDATSSGFLEATSRTLGCALPLQANRFVDAENGRVCWLGPSEWLIMIAASVEARTAERLRAALTDEFAAVTEIGSAQAVLGVNGSHARELVAKGCPLDLHPRVFGPGHCAQTLLARAGVTILQTSDAPVFELVVRRSYADYVWRWLTDAKLSLTYKRHPVVQ